MILKWIIAGGILFIGLFTMVSTFHASRRLFYSQDARLSEYLVSSLLFGVWVCLVLLGIILILGALESSYQWTGAQLLGLIAIGLVAGAIAAAGALWQYFVAGRFREALYRWLQRKHGR